MQVYYFFNNLFVLLHINSHFRIQTRESLKRTADLPLKMLLWSRVAKDIFPAKVE